MAYKMCNAKSKRSGERCRARAMKGSEKCYHHGGKTPNGAALPQYKTGRYSKYLPARLAAKYEDAQKDADLLVLRSDVALVDTRLAELLERVDTGETAQQWKAAQDALNDYRRAKAAADVKRMSSALYDLEQAVDAGGDYQAWAEIAALLDQRRKLVESERKRLVEMQQVITAERAMILITSLISVIKDHVTDRSTLSAITADIGKLITIDADAGS